MPGSRRRALSSTRVAAMSRNSVATSRSRVSMRSSSVRYASTISASDTSQSSTSCLRIRWRSRSKGPSKTGVRTAYDIGSSVPAATPSGGHPEWPDPGLAHPGSLTPHATRVLGHPAHRRDPSGQLPRRGPALGGGPGAVVGTGPDAVLRGRPPRPHPAVGHRHLRRRHPPHRDAPPRRRARPRALHAVRPEPRAPAHRADLAPELHRDLRRAATA